MFTICNDDAGFIQLLHHFVFVSLAVDLGGMSATKCNLAHVNRVIKDQLYKVTSECIQLSILTNYLLDAIIIQFLCNTVCTQGCIYE